MPPSGVGDRLGPYEILASVGAGGMGQVYRARDTRLNREVALKILPPDIADDPSRRQRFEQEARALAALNHPNILAVYDVGLENGRSYMVTELVDGETLREAGLSQRTVIDITAQIAEGLAAAHAVGITHRDLKPENVMVTHDGRAKILDFGLSKLNRSSSADGSSVTRTEAGTVMGTVGYMSPEQARGQEVDYRSDLFSLGAVLYELLSGKRAFEAESAVETLNAILKQDPAELPESVPSGLRRIVHRCLEKKPSERFQSAKDLSFALRTMSGTSKSISGPVAVEVRKRGPRWTVAAVGGLVMMLGLIAWRLATEPPRIDISGYRFRPFATETYDESEPSWSPDGKSLAYVKRPKAGYELTVRSLDRSAPAIIARSPRPMFSISWSPDGGRLFYIESAFLEVRSGRVLSVARAGGEPVEAVKGLCHAVALSPDGRTLAVLMGEEVDGARQGSLLLFSPPGSVARRVAAFPPLVGTNRLSWSLNGKKVSVSMRRSSSLSIFDVGTASVRNVPGMDDSILSHVWLADNRRVLVTQTAESDPDHTNLWLLDTETGERSLALAGADGVGAVTVNPISGAIAYVGTPTDYDLVELPLDGSAARPLLATRQAERWVAFSPVAPEFAYFSQGELRLRRRDGSPDRVVAARAEFPAGVRGFASPSFSPDGSRIVYGTNLPGFAWISPVGGGSPARLQDLQTLIAPAWSPDGRWIAMEKSGALVKVRVGSEAGEEKVTAGPCTPSWSPDGARILCSGGGALYTIPSSGGEKAYLGKEYEALATWSKDLRYLYVIRSADTKRQLGRLDWQNAVFQPIVDVPVDWIFSSGINHSNRLTLAHDGKSLATTIQRATGDIWVLDGFHAPATFWQRLWR